MGFKATGRVLFPIYNYSMVLLICQGSEISHNMASPFHPLKEQQNHSVKYEPASRRSMSLITNACLPVGRDFTGVKT